MSFLSRLISNILSRKERQKPEVEFGKYIQPFDQPSSNEKYKQAVELYRKGKALDAYAMLFEFLTDPEQQNLSFTKSNHKIDFELYQGSKKITGQITEHNINALALVASYEGTLPVTLTDLLLQENHKLKYSKFAVDASNLSMHYSALTKITGPEDLYKGLRELAIFADSYDDILVERYSNLKPVNIQHIMPLSDKEVSVRIDFLRQWIKSTVNLVEKLARDKYSKEQNKGLIGYLLLGVIYKIYYLLAPEGVLLDFLKQMDSVYWSEGETILQKNDYVLSSLEELLAKPDDYFRKSLYKVKSTFSVVEPVKNSKIIDFVSSELETANWLKSQNRTLYLRVCEYIIGYLNFHVALKSLHQELLNVLWRLLNDDYFLALGYSVNFLSRNKLNSFAIEYQINRILNKYQTKAFRASRLDYSMLPEFVKSFLLEFINLLRNEQ